MTQKSEHLYGIHDMVDQMKYWRKLFTTQDTKKGTFVWEFMIWSGRWYLGEH